MQHIHSHYPSGQVKFAEYFRVKNIPYSEYSNHVIQYIENAGMLGKLRICALGCGTGHYEINFLKRGHFVVGIDRDMESIEIAKDNASDLGIEFEIFHSDIFDENKVDSFLKDKEPFDVITMFGVGVSMEDHRRAGIFMSRYLNQNGLFITGLWNYKSNFNFEVESELSDTEIAESPNGDKDFCVRMNNYTYKHKSDKYLIEWNAVYIYPDENNFAKIEKKQTDIMEIAPIFEGKDPLNMPNNLFEKLHTFSLEEFSSTMNFPNTYEYLISWKKK
jgi:SAM-dependent methyltransferase